MPVKRRRSRRQRDVKAVRLWVLLALAIALNIALIATAAEAPKMTPQQIVEHLEATIHAGLGDEEGLEERESLIDALAACGDQAIPAIAARLGEADVQVAMDLMRALVGIGSDAAIGLLLEQLAHSSSPVIANWAISVLENTAIARPLSPDELAALTTRVTTEHVTRSGLAARVLGNCRAIAVEERLSPIMSRFEREVLSREPLAPVLMSYVSPRVFVLNQFLLAFSNIGAPGIPMLRQKRAQFPANSDLDKWFLLALGMAGDEAVSDELKKLVLGEADIYVRCTAVRAYARSAKQAAIPLLESLLDDPTESAYGDSFSQRIRLIAMTARDALVRLKRTQGTSAN